LFDYQFKDFSLKIQINNPVRLGLLWVNTTVNRHTPAEHLHKPKMKTLLRHVQLSTLGALLVLLAACSKPTGGGSTLPDASPKVQGLRIGKEYQNNKPTGSPIGGGYVYGATVFVFANQGVSVFKVIGDQGNIFLEKRDDGNYYVASSNGGHPKGTKVSDNLDVVFGPGDRVPVLENAPYKVEGSSVYVDWSQNHSQFFKLTFSDSGSEVFTIKNDGLVLESSTTPGFTLTLNMSAR
jgi:hypothetical protein